MVLTKSERIEVGKKVHEGEMSGVQAALKYGVSTTSVYRWVFAYRKSAGLPTGESAKPASKPLGVSAAAANPPEYDAMGKEELIRELMRRDIEVARLKKGYSVKGGGSKKEYVTISDSSTK